MNSPQTTQPPTGLLVIGYGNTLRGDDGVGPRVADAVRALDLPGVKTLSCQQLSQEQATLISQAAWVVFVDAAVDAPREVQWRELEPGKTPQLMAHAADPRTRLALARDVFGHAPKAWWLAIPVEDLVSGSDFLPPVNVAWRRRLNGLVNSCPGFRLYPDR